jgi:hypothetical protein
VVEALELKEGDDIEIRIAGKRTFEVSRDGPATSARPPAQVEPSFAGRVCLRPRTSE